jgi:TPR repeat protein
MTRGIRGLCAAVLLVLSVGAAQAQTVEEAEAQYLRGDYAAALPAFRAAAELGNVTAQFYLAVMYEYGLGVEKNSPLAMFWYGRAAEQGDSVAQFVMATKYSIGIGVPRNYDKALLWFRSAAEQGHVLAQSHLASMFAAGHGVPRDYQTAYFWYLLASARGNQAAIAGRDLIEERLTPSERARAQAAAREWKPKPTPQR